MKQNVCSELVRYNEWLHFPKRPTSSMNILLFLRLRRASLPIHSHQLLRVGDHGHYTLQIDTINTIRSQAVDLPDKSIRIIGLDTTVLAPRANVLHRLHRLGDPERLTFVGLEPIVLDCGLAKFCGEGVC